MSARHASPSSRLSALPSSRTSWLMLVILVLLTAIVSVQDTRYALIVKQKTGELWSSVIAAICAVVILRSGLARDSGSRRSQLALGTVSNSYYGPRRRWLTDGGAVVGGVAGGLWWGVSTWAVLWRGMLRGTTNRGLLSFEMGVVVGVLTGGLVGAAIGLLLGDVWERLHRRRRLRAQPREPLSILI